MITVNPISVRLPTELRAWLASKAEDEGRSLNRQIVQILKSAQETDAVKATN